MGSYEEVWESFSSEHRLEFGGYMDPGWRDAHALSACFMVPVDVSCFQERLEPLKEALRPLPYVSLHPDHFMHITLLLLGFLVQEPEDEGDISREWLAEVEGSARRSLAGFPAFSVRLANLNAFPGAAFVETHDGGMLEKLRREVCQGCGLKTPSGPPHLTLAYFQAPDGTTAPEDLVSTIDRYRDWPIGEIQVDRVELTLLNLREEYPSPETLAEIFLKTT